MEEHNFHIPLKLEIAAIIALVLVVVFAFLVFIKSKNAPATVKVGTRPAMIDNRTQNEKVADALVSVNNNKTIPTPDERANIISTLSKNSSKTKKLSTSEREKIISEINRIYQSSK